MKTSRFLVFVSVIWSNFRGYD